jgi:hypothetical protein
VRAAAARRLERQDLEGKLARQFETLDIDGAGRHPIDVLLGAVRRFWAMVQLLDAMVGDLEADDLWGPNHLGDQAPHVATTMYADWLDRATKASKLALDAGIDERRVQLAEAEARRFARAMRAVIRAFGHNPDTPEARAIIRRELTAAWDDDADAG